MVECSFTNVVVVSSNNVAVSKIPKILNSSFFVVQTVLEKFHLVHVWFDQYKQSNQDYSQTGIGMEWTFKYP